VLDKWDGPQVMVIELGVGWDDGDPVAHASQRDERMRRCGLEGHSRAEMRAPACCIEPLPRQELPV
jgi:hypothetical protein